mmetsp:Transcript_66410/g.167409  ORF Transcript_66410/g.167409 Transcript_66410/m.167409 type:complete len:326 (-) Transcript_66410:206-1183(-)
MLVLYHDLLHCQEGKQDDILHFPEQPLDLLRVIARHQVQLQVVEIPLPAPLLVVVLVVLLNCHIREVDHGVGQVIHGEPSMGKAGETAAVHVDDQGRVARDQHVQSQVKLFATNKEWLGEVPLDHVWLRLRLLVLFFLVHGRTPIGQLLPLLHPARISFPSRDLAELVEQEDAFTLRLSDGLHDPDGACCLQLFEFLHEHGVLSRQDEGLWRACSVARRVLQETVALGLPLSTLDVLHHQVLTGKLVMISEVVDALVRLQVDVVEDLVDPLLVAPKEVPIKLGIRLLEATCLQDIVDSIVKGTPEPHLSPRGDLPLSADMLPQQI